MLSTLSCTGSPAVRFISELERGKASAELGKVLDVLAVLGLRLLLVGAEAGARRVVGGAGAAEGQ